MEQVVTKFGSLKIDNDGGRGMYCDAMHHHATCQKLTTKLSHLLLLDPSVCNVNITCTNVDRKGH